MKSETKFTIREQIIQSLETTPMTAKDLSRSPGNARNAENQELSRQYLRSLKTLDFTGGP